MSILHTSQPQNHVILMKIAVNFMDVPSQTCRREHRNQMPQAYGHHSILPRYVVFSYGRQGGTSLSNDNLANAAWTISTLFHLLLLSVACVQAQHKPKLFPISCAHLEPEPCTYVHSKGPKGYDLKYYYEKCKDHQCIFIMALSGPSPPGDHDDKVGSVSQRVTFPYVEQPFYDHYSRTRFTRPLKRGNVSLAKFLDPSLFRVDSEGRFMRRSDFWFCGADVINYRARVQLDTGLTAGQKEDMFVHCEWLRMESFLGLSNCETQTYPCEECLSAYRNYLCAMYFPKCQESETGKRARGSKPENETDGVIYANANISSLVGAEYTITKPCRGLCWDVARKCIYYVGVKCHRYEDREYGDPPDCNFANSQDAELIII